MGVDLEKVNGYVIVWRDGREVAVPTAAPSAVTEPIRVTVVAAGAPPGGKAYDAKELSLATARVAGVNEEKWVINGDKITAWTDGDLEGVGIRLVDTRLGLTVENFPIIYFNRFNPITVFYFTEIYVVSGVQASKTLQLFVGREAGAEAGPSTTVVSTSQSFQRIRTDKGSHFTGTIAQNAHETESLPGLLKQKIRIVGVALQSDQQLNYRVIFWTKDSFDDTDLDVDSLLAEVEVPLVTYGYQIAAGNQWRLDIRGLAIDYQDDDGTNELHLSLQNLSSASKVSGSSGEVVVEITYEPRT